jgi:DNA-binding transcriptional regulator GbsR (MarR family)
MYLYLREEECSLDSICEGLGLSKAAVSTAVRQLETMGLLRQVWKKGDRKNYYRPAENIGTALQQGLLTFVRQKIQPMAMEIDLVSDLLEKEIGNSNSSPDTKFVHSRVKRAKHLRDLAAKFLENPLLNFFPKI